MLEYWIRVRLGSCASTVHAFQGSMMDTQIAGIEANHPHLSTQRSHYAVISRAGDWTELVTNDKPVLQDQLEGVVGERIAALEAVKPESAKGHEPGVDAGWSVGRENNRPASGEGDHASEPARK